MSQSVVEIRRVNKDGMDHETYIQFILHPTFIHYTRTSICYYLFVKFHNFAQVLTIMDWTDPQVQLVSRTNFAFSNALHEV